MRLYSHIATGNYHSGTAKGYVDLGLLTADQDIGQDLVKLFNFYTGPTLDEEFRKLLIAPVTMRSEFRRMIRREAEHVREGRDARIVAKMNALEDPAIVEELYRASRAGVDIDLVVRDICRLRPGLESASETISVHSIVGRFLEHSRIYYFENGGDPEYYLGSADWMTRNLDNRVEAISPVEDPEIRTELQFILAVMLHDNRKRWRMHADGSYTQLRPAAGEQPRNTQEILMDRTLSAGRNEDVYGDIPTKDYDFDTELLIEPHQSSERSESNRVDNSKRASRNESAVSDESPEPPADADSGNEWPPVMQTYSDHWYVPDSDRYNFAVRTPDGDRNYRVTVDAVVALLIKHYGDGTEGER